MNQMDQNKFLNAPNILIENFFSKEDLQRVNDSIKDDTATQLVHRLGYLAYHITLPDDIIKRSEEEASRLMDEEMILSEYQIALYKDFIIDDVKTFPILFPHTDESFSEPRFSIDCVLDSNIMWPVEIQQGDEVVSISANIGDVLTFSGTHQYHWRPKRKFEEKDFIKLLFMHFKQKNGETIPEEDFKYIKSLENDIMNKWLTTPGRSFNKNYE